MARIDPDEPCPCGSRKLFKNCHGPSVRTNTPPEILQRIALPVIAEPDPNTRTVFEKTGEGTILFQGFETSTALVCGTCAAVLVAGLHRDQLTRLVLRCKLCGSFNET